MKTSLIQRGRQCIALSVLLIPLMLSVARSQLPYWRTCDTCFHGFDRNWRDSHIFEIGGEGLQRPGQAKSELGMTFGYNYGGPISLWRYSDSTRWTLAHGIKRWVDSVRADFWRGVYDTSFNMMIAPLDIFNMNASCMAQEYFFQASIDPVLPPYYENFVLKDSGQTYHDIPRNFAQSVDVVGISARRYCQRRHSTPATATTRRSTWVPVASQT